jgi:hypothetical protein
MLSYNIGVRERGACGCTLAGGASITLGLCRGGGGEGERGRECV